LGTWFVFPSDFDATGTGRPPLGGWRPGGSGDPPDGAVTRRTDAANQAGGQTAEDYRNASARPAGILLADFT